MIAIRVGLLCLLFAGLLADQVAAETWRGLTVAPERRCSAYDRHDYPYPRTIEARIVAGMGGRIYGPYEGRLFGSTRETDIEHIVAVSEAHDSGLCAADAATRRRFSGDLLNLTLASPAVNRCGRGGKCGHDAAEWLPKLNRCWFAGRIMQVRRKYGLTIDRRETETLEHILRKCASTDMRFVVADGATAGRTPNEGSGPVREAEALRKWDDNRNGQITCREARRHGIAPVRRTHPAYPFMHDGDGDGIVCE